MCKLQTTGQSLILYELRMGFAFLKDCKNQKKVYVTETIYDQESLKYLLPGLLQMHGLHDSVPMR